jgi:hypothetical protein
MAHQTNAVLPVVQPLADGSYLSQIVAASDHRHRRDPITVRVVEYTLGKDPGRPSTPAPYRLLTSILDPPRHPRPTTVAVLHAGRGDQELQQQPAGVHATWRLRPWTFLAAS